MPNLLINNSYSYSRISELIFHFWRQCVNYSLAITIVSPWPQENYFREKRLRSELLREWATNLKLALSVIFYSLNQTLYKSNYSFCLFRLCFVFSHRVITGAGCPHDDFTTAIHLPFLSLVTEGVKQREFDRDIEVERKEGGDTCSAASPLLRISFLPMGTKDLGPGNSVFYGFQYLISLVIMVWQLSV